MKAGKYKKEYYSELHSWWNTRDDWVALPEDVLPETGFVVIDDGILLAAGFVYRDATSILGMMEWIVSNPKNTARTTMKSLLLLVKHIAKYADENNIKLYTSLKNTGLERIYKQNGFIKTDQNMISMVRR